MMMQQQEWSSSDSSERRLCVQSMCCQFLDAADANRLVWETGREWSEKARAHRPVSIIYHNHVQLHCVCVWKGRAGKDKTTSRMS